jgi:hypothetical protein
MSSIVPDLVLPIIVVDEAHWQKVLNKGAEPLEYEVATREGFRISTQGFQFTIPENCDFLAPNIIQIIVGKEQLYAVAYEKGTSMYTVNKPNLVPMYGSKPFAGFQKDQKIIVAIGHLAPPRPDLPQPKFTVIWAGVVNIF